MLMDAEHKAQKQPDATFDDYSWCVCVVCWMVCFVCGAIMRQYETLWRQHLITQRRIRYPYAGGGGAVFYLWISWTAVGCPSITFCFGTAWMRYACGVWSLVGWATRIVFNVSKYVYGKKGMCDNQSHFTDTKRLYKTILYQLYTINYIL